MPYYWKRGLIVGLVVGFLLHGLLLGLEARRPDVPEGNFVTARTERQAHKGTPLGPLLGLTVFALCCVMPGPKEGKVGG